MERCVFQPVFTNGLYFTVFSQGWNKSITFALFSLLIMIQSASANWDSTAFHVGENFESLIAAPREPRFFSSFQNFDGGKPLNSFKAALVGLGENIGLMRWQDKENHDSWELGITSGLFSLFKLRQKNSDLVNSDFMVGLTSSYKGGPSSYRFRLYHMSSHLGDEFLIKKDIERVNYSFETLDFTASRQWGSLRTYGGGGYVVRSKPVDIGKLSTFVGSEYRSTKSLWGDSYITAGLHAAFTEQNNWKPSVHALVGLEFGQARTGQRRFGINLDAYEGYSPWGQFYDVKVRTYGSSMYVRF